MAFAGVLQDFNIEHKILSVTCDNASNNNTMVEELDNILTSFSPVNRTRCFTHILNLVSKSLLRQFDVKKDDKSGRDIDDNERVLLDLAGDIEHEESDMAKANDTVDGEMDDDDNLEGWVDEVAAFTPEERQVLEESVRPVKRMLVKVRQRVCEAYFMLYNLMAFT
jgi:hypothetical protein